MSNSLSPFASRRILSTLACGNYVVATRGERRVFVGAGQISRATFQLDQALADGSGAGIASRRITDDDLDVLAEFLGTGLGYPSSHYAEVLARLKERQAPPDFPRYGYALTHDGKIVGAMVQIYSVVPGSDGPTVRCHMASWCVLEQYRVYAALFFRKALSAPDVTFINTSARPVALPSIAAQGFKRYSDGQFLSFPLLQSARGESGVRTIDGEARPDVPFDPDEHRVLVDHARYGCISVWCLTAERAYPFVFHKRSFRGFLPGVQLVYCSHVDQFVRFATPLGRHLRKRQVYMVRVDASAAVPGLPGLYFDGMEPRYFKGSVAPRLGDLAYTQTVLTKSRRRGSAASF